MSTPILNEPRYQQLLDEALPVVIHDDAEHARLLQVASRLMDKPEADISEEEGRLLEMLSVLIEEYEARRLRLPITEPHKMLAHLLGEKGMRPSALWSILPKSRVSEILAGKRGISKTQAKQLAALFRVPVDLFL